MNFILDTVLSLSLLFLLLDSYMYGGFIRSHLGLSSKLIAALALVFLLILKKFKKVQPDQILLKLNRTILLPLLLIVQIGSTYAEKFIHANYLYGLVHLDVYQLVYLLLFSFLLAIVFPLKKRWYQQLMIFLSGLMVALPAFLIRVKGYMGFTDIFVGDDKPLEWVQLGFFIIAAIFSGLIVQKLLKLKKSWVLTIIYILGAIVLIFLIGEEISWGQRLLGITTPEAWKETNLQNEINLHNQQGFFGYVYWFYIRFTFYCSFAWLAKALLPKSLGDQLELWLKLLVPPWYLISFFFISFIMFHLHRDLHYPLNEFEEFNELLISQGLSFFMIINYQWLKRTHEVKT